MRCRLNASGIGLPMLNGRWYGAGLKWMNAGAVGTIWPVLDTKMLNWGPSAFAPEFRLAGWSAEPVQWPVSSRFSRTPTAVIVSAGVNAQCPARCTKICRSSEVLPAWPTTLR